MAAAVEESGAAPLGALQALTARRAAFRGELEARPPCPLSPPRAPPAPIFCSPPHPPPSPGLWLLAVVARFILLGFSRGGRGCPAGGGGGGGGGGASSCFSTLRTP